MRFVRLALLVFVPLLANAQTTTTIPLSYSDDASAKAAIGLTHEAVEPTCNSGVVPGDKCGTLFDLDYWQFSRCQTGSDFDCLAPKGTGDEPCDTTLAHPGEWWLPLNTNNFIAGDNIVNLSLVPIEPTWTSVTLKVPGVFHKHFVDGNGVAQPTAAAKVGGFGFVAYLNSDNYGSISVDVDINGVTTMTARSKENANYYSFWVKIPIALDGPDGINFTGNLRIDRNGNTYTYMYTRDLVVTPATNWTIIPWPQRLGGFLPTRTASFATPTFMGFYTQNAQTSISSCARFGGFTVTQ
jgi:hypothetical protein